MQMPPIRGLGVVGITLLGVWAMVQAASMALFLLGAVATDSTGDWLWPQLIPLFGQATVGGILIGIRIPLARALFPDSETHGPSEQEVRPVLEFVVAIFGLWLLVSAAETALHAEAMLLSSFSSQQEFGFGGDRLSLLASREAWVARIPYLVRGAVGAALVIWSAGTVGVWQRVRNAGRAKPPYNKALNADVE